MTAQVLFFNVFPEKDPHLNAIEICKWLLLKFNESVFDHEILSF